MRGRAGSDLRERIADLCFPLAAPSVVPRRRIAIGYIACILAGFTYLIVIPSGRSHLFRIWAEDGADWLSDAALYAPFSHLFEPLGGYFHLVPRVLAQGVVLLPVESWSMAIAAGAAAIRVLAALLVFHVGRGLVVSPALRALIATSMVVLPTGNGDTINSAANLHWFLFVALCWVCLWRPRSAHGIVASVALTIALTLSVPLGLVLSPIALLRLIVTHEWRDRAQPLALLVSNAAVSAALLTADRPREAGADATELLSSAAVRGPLTALVGPQATADLLALGPGVPGLVPLAATLASALMLGPVVVGLVKGRPTERFLLAGLTLLAAFCAIFNLWSNWRDFLAVDFELRAPRYSNLPGMLLWAALLIGLAAMWRLSRAATVSLGALAACLVLMGAVYQQTYPSGRAISPYATGITWEHGVETAREECAFPEDTVAITILPHDAWKAVVPCSVLD